MDVASITEIKRELKELPHDQLLEICLRLTKFKKENKELLNYLLFESYDEDSYSEAIKNKIASEFEDINQQSVYLLKKSIRRILKLLNKYIKYSGKIQTETELRIFFCERMRKLRFPIKESRVLTNLYNQQLLSIGKALNKLDEDLRFDYQADIDRICDL